MLIKVRVFERFWEYGSLRAQQELHYLALNDQRKYTSIDRTANDSKNFPNLVGSMVKIQSTYIHYVLCTVQ